MNQVNTMQSAVDLVDTYTKIRSNGKKKRELDNLTFELANILQKYPEVRDHFRSRTDQFYRMSLGEPDYYKENKA